MEQDRLMIEPPTELRFRGPFTEVVSSVLLITNPTDKVICYKVKTTAPKKYCAQPNGGVLQPQQSETVSIMLQPFEVRDNVIHKLMIQYLLLPSDDTKYEEAWRNVKKSDLKDSILQCLLEDEDGPQVNGVSPTTPTPLVTDGDITNSDIANSDVTNGDTKVENGGNKTSSLKKLNKDLDTSHFRTSICAINQTIKSESSMEVLTQLQTTMAELHQKIASLIERFNQESVQEIISLKVRLEQLEDKMAEKNAPEPAVVVSKIPQPKEKTKGKLVAKSSNSTQNVTSMIDKLQRKEEESARKIALLTEKIEIQKSQQEAQQQAFRNTTAQQMTDLLQRIDLLTRQTAMTQRLFNAVKPHWLIPQGDVKLSQHELGSGGWGKVVKANYKGEQVAAKCLHHQIVSDHNIQQLVHEIDIFSKCYHPSLIKFLGATLDGDPVILTELMHTNLQTVIKQKQLADYQIIPLLQDIASAINYLHGYKPDPIIHRDISSTNILLEGPVKSRWVAKLSDFWSSNFLWNTSEQSVSPGNPTYAAPEVRNPRSHSEKMDIYSFGVLVFEVCSGKSPSLQVRNEVLPTAATEWRKPQCDFVPLIISCTRENKEDRPTMTEVLAFL